MLAVAGQPVDDDNHLIVDAERIRKTKQGIAGCFDPHDETTRGAGRVFEKEAREKEKDFPYIQIVCIAQRSVNIETQSFYA